MKKVIKWWRARKRLGMSELGKELFEAMEGDDVWEHTEYRIRHKASGIELWVANGPTHFHIHAVPHAKLNDEQLKTALTARDCKVLWDAYKVMLRRHASAPARITLNILRLGRIKESGESNDA